MAYNTGKLTILSLVFLLISVPAPVRAVPPAPWDAYRQYIPGNTPLVKRQLRGTWITTTQNLDWPSARTRALADDGERIRKSREELVGILDRAAELKLNAIFLQVSPEGDAFYRSGTVPWSRYLTGVFGKDPGFDPLAFAIDEAHKRNLEIHAWFNPYRLSMDTNASTLQSLDTAKSVYREHPQWVRTAMNRLVVDPGIPGAREWVMDRVMEVVKNYDIDGVHFDDYFYEENKEGELKDDETFKMYNGGLFSDKGDWRRNNTYLLIKELSAKIRSAKPWVKFGISPGGVWGNKADGLPDGSDTVTGYTNYGRSFADTKKWVEEELIDYIAPQIYFTFANTRAPYGELAGWWTKVCGGRNVQLYIGQALYKINSDSDEYFMNEKGLQELSSQLRFNAANPGISGSIMFRMNNFNDASKRQAVSLIKSDLWSAKALVPVMPWKGGKAPARPTGGRLEAAGGGGVKLAWKDEDPGTAYYAVYRYNKGENADVASDASAAKLIGTVRKTAAQAQEFTDTDADSPQDIYYVITALDRLHNESAGLKISPSVSAYFNDVGEDYAWAADSIDRLYKAGVFGMNADKAFNPEEPADKAGFISMAAKGMKLGKAAAAAFDRSMGGPSRPGESITREEAAKALYNAVKAAGKKMSVAGKGASNSYYLKKYKDEQLISAGARDAVAWMVKAGLLQGGDGGLNPGDSITRAEAAVLLEKVLKYAGLLK